MRVDAGSPSKWRATFEVLKLTESSAFSQLFLSRSRWPAFEGSDKHWWSGPFALVANGRQHVVPIEQPRNLLKNLGLVRLAGFEPATFCSGDNLRSRILLARLAFSSVMEHDFAGFSGGFVPKLFPNSWLNP